MIDALFGSKTRVKLLGLFMNNPHRSFYVREITRNINEQINSVRRELANLVRIGIITDRSVDNRLYYQADTKFRYFASLKDMFANDQAIVSGARRLGDPLPSDQGGERGGLLGRDGLRVG